MRNAKALIAANALEIERMRRRIHEAFASRSQSTENWKSWSDACAEFHLRYQTLAYPGGMGPWSAIMRGDSGAIDTAIDFLEVDARFFRSGYMKEYLWQRLKSCDLTEQQLDRLECVGIAYLGVHRPLREFWCMSRFMKVRGSFVFWDAVEQRAKSPAMRGSTMATWLIASRMEVDIIGWLRAEQWRPGVASGRDFLRRYPLPSSTLAPA